MKKVKYAASLMCMDFLNIKEQFEILNKRADLYHVDMMDGHFCKNITLSPDMVRTFSKVAALPMDVHFMTTNPLDWIELCADAGAKILSPHAETINTCAFRTMNLIESLGCQKGLVLNPATPIEYVKHYLDRVDLLTIMTVDVGFAGQPFVEEMVPKIAEAAEFREKHGLKYLIQIDGSCNERTYKKLVNAGADALVMGSTGLFKNDPDLNKAFDILEETYERAMNA